MAIESTLRYQRIEILLKKDFATEWGRQLLLGKRIARENTALTQKFCV